MALTMQAIIFLLLFLQSIHGQSEESSDENCDTEQGELVRIDCPFKSLMLEYCYLCYYSPQEEMMICDGWSEDQIRDQCQSANPLWLDEGTPGKGSCAIQDVSDPFDAYSGWSCPLKPQVLPLEILSNTTDVVTIEVTQLYNLTAAVGYMAVDCIDPNTPGGDPAGGMPPTCDGCCPHYLNAEPGELNGGQRQCKCTDGFATVGVYLQDPAINDTYVLYPPVPAHCQLPTANSTGVCRFVYRVPCGCTPEKFDLGGPEGVLLKPATIITTEPDGTTRIRQTLNTEYTPEDPAAGPAVYTNLAADIKIDPAMFGIVDLTLYFDDARALSCGSMELEGETVGVLVINVTSDHELVTVLDPEFYDSPELIVTAPPTWECGGASIFNRVLAKEYSNNKEVLYVITAVLPLEEAIKEGEVTLGSNNLMGDLSADDTPTKTRARNGTNGTNATNGTGTNVSSNAASSLQHLLWRQPKSKVQNSKFAPQFFDKIVDLADELIVQPVKDGINAVKTIVKLIQGKADIDTRLKSLDLTIEKEFSWGDQQNDDETVTKNKSPIILDLITRIHFSIGLNFKLQIEDYKLKYIELAIEGELDLSVDAFVLVGGMITYEKEIEAFEKKFKPIKFMMGVVPVVLLPAIPLNFGVEVGAEGGLKLSANAKAGGKLKAGVAYTAGKGFHEIWEFEKVFEYDKSVSIHAAFYITPYIKPSFAMNAYGIIELAINFQLGPLFTVTALLCNNDGKLAATFLVDLDLTFTVDLTFKLGFDLPFLQFFEDWDIYLFSWAMDLLDWSMGPYEFMDPLPLLDDCSDEAPVPGGSPARIAEFVSRKDGVKPGDALPQDSADPPTWILQSKQVKGGSGCSGSPFKEAVATLADCETFCDGFNFLDYSPDNAGNGRCACRHTCDFALKGEDWPGEGGRVWVSAAFKTAGAAIADLLPYPAPGGGDARTIVQDISNKDKRCSGSDGLGSHSFQPTADACFAHCETLRGCGMCERFSWSATALDCMFSTAAHSSCTLEPYRNFTVFVAKGECSQGAMFDAATDVEEFLSPQYPGTMVGPAASCAEIILSATGSVMGGAGIAGGEAAAVPYVDTPSSTWIMAAVDGADMKMVKVQCTIVDRVAHFQAVEAARVPSAKYSLTEMGVYRAWHRSPETVAIATGPGAAGHNIKKLALEPVPPKVCEWSTAAEHYSPAPAYVGPTGVVLYNLEDAKAVCTALGPKHCVAISCPQQDPNACVLRTKGAKAPFKGWSVHFLTPECYRGGCKAWYCSCQGLSDVFQTSPAEWGSATPAAKAWWQQTNCQTTPSNLCGEWGAWSACTVTCDGGERTRQTVGATAGLCPKKEREVCNAQACGCDTLPEQRWRGDFSKCPGTAHNGHCVSPCLPGYKGNITAVCDKSVGWHYRDDTCELACRDPGEPDGRIDGVWTKRVGYDEYAAFPRGCSRRPNARCKGTCKGAFGSPTGQAPVATCQLDGSWKVDSDCELNRDCLGRWSSSWGRCSATCGEGTQTRLFTTWTWPKGEGAPCPPPETRKCNSGPCPCCPTTEFNLDGTTSEDFQGWYTKTDDVYLGRPVYRNNNDFFMVYHKLFSTRTSRLLSERWYVVQDQIAPNGTVLLASKGQFPIHELALWKSSDPAATYCPGPGKVYFDKVVTQRGRGSNSVGYGAWSMCGTIPDIDCVVEWGPWSACPVGCGGTKTREAQPTVMPSGNGQPCPASPERQLCPFDPNLLACKCQTVEGFSKACPRSLETGQLDCLVKGSGTLDYPYESLERAMAACKTIGECAHIVEESPSDFRLRRRNDPVTSGTGQKLLTCSDPTCFDGEQNGDEEGVDCGGSCRDCTGDPDLAAYKDTGGCGPVEPNYHSYWCSPDAPPPRCNEFVETALCGTNMARKINEWSDIYINDCHYSYYAQYECLLSTCNDGMRNGDEVGLDCGGSCNTACPDPALLRAWYHDGQCSGPPQHNMTVCRSIVRKAPKWMTTYVRNLWWDDLGGFSHGNDPVTTCDEAVDVPSHVCPSSRAQLVKMVGRLPGNGEPLSSVPRSPSAWDPQFGGSSGGSNCSKYFVSAQYECANAFPGLEFYGRGWCKESCDTKYCNPLPWERQQTCTPTFERCASLCKGKPTCMALNYDPTPPEEKRYGECKDRNEFDCTIYYHTDRGVQRKAVGATYRWSSTKRWECYRVACTLGPWCAALQAAGMDEADLPFVTHAGGEWAYLGRPLGVGFGEPGEACDAARLVCAGGSTYGSEAAQVAQVIQMLTGCDAPPDGTAAHMTFELNRDCDIGPKGVCWANCLPGYTSTSGSEPYATCLGGEWKFAKVTCRATYSFATQLNVAGSGTATLPDVCLWDASRSSPYPAAAAGDELAVLCCDDGWSSTSSRPGCVKSATKSEAARQCKTAGKQLCSRKQVKSMSQEDPKCPFDSLLVWTNDACAANHTVVGTAERCAPGAVTEDVDSAEACFRLCAAVRPRSDCYEFSYNALTRSCAHGSSSSARSCTREAAAAGWSRYVPDMWRATDGCPRASRPPGPRWTPGITPLGVRCCAMDGSTCTAQAFGNLSCIQAGSVYTAMERCHTYGMRLCTPAELASEVCCQNEGCDNTTRVWTSQSLVDYPPTCGDGELNGDEIGVDCGGSCAACTTTCSDLLQNGDETGVDCGGSCPECPCFKLVKKDAYCPDHIALPDVTSVEECVGEAFAQKRCGGYIFSNNDTCRCMKSDTPNDGSRVPDGCNPDETTSGSSIYWIADCSTCSDGHQNGDEEGPDCGGSCAACPTCGDGQQNGDETGVDCGGSCAACPTCGDGQQNGDETGVDCGGSCAACPTCGDGQQNGDETGVDCGGSCTACLSPGISPLVQAAHKWAPETAGVGSHLRFCPLVGDPGESLTKAEQDAQHFLRKSAPLTPGIYQSTATQMLHSSRHLKMRAM